MRENYLLQKQCNCHEWKLVMKWEFASRNTPQQNSIAEVAFWTIKHHGMVMMTATNIPKNIQFMVHKEAFTTACRLNWLMPISIDGVTKTQYEHWMIELHDFSKHMRVWGEAGMATYTKDTSAKLEEQGMQCIFVGYESEH